MNDIDDITSSDEESGFDVKILFSRGLKQSPISIRENEQQQQPPPQKKARISQITSSSSSASSSSSHQSILTKPIYTKPSADGDTDSVVSQVSQSTHASTSSHRSRAVKGRLRLRSRRPIEPATTEPGY